MAETVFDKIPVVLLEDIAYNPSTSKYFRNVTKRDTENPLGSTELFKNILRNENTYSHSKINHPNNSEKCALDINVEHSKDGNKLKSSDPLDVQDLTDLKNTEVKGKCKGVRTDSRRQTDVNEVKSERIGNSDQNKCSVYQEFSRQVIGETFAESDSFFCSRCHKRFLDESVLGEHECTVPKGPVSPVFSRRPSQRKIHDKKGDTIEIVENKLMSGYECNHCNSVLSSKSYLQMHLRRHVVDCSVTCDVCNKQFSFKGNFATHYKRCHTNIKPFYCSECGKSFFDKKDRDVHIRVHSKIKPFTCRQCGKKCSQFSNLKRHLLTHSGRREFECSMCGKTFLNKGHLSTHITNHLVTTRKEFNCSECSKHFSSKNRLSVHMAIHSGLKFPCPICAKLFSQEAGVRTHMLIHTGKKSFFCSECGKQFQVKVALLNHVISRHSSEKPFKCFKCGNCFSLKSTLSRHIDCHSEIKKIACTQCEKRFHRNSGLRQHMYVHTAVKPFTCGTCGKQFSRSDCLRSHMNIHSGIKSYVCDICAGRFYTQSALSTHMHVHYGLKPFTCENCDRRFSRKDHLKVHLQTHYK